MPAHQLTAKGKEETPKEDICLFGQTNFRNQMRRFGIKTDDRRRHMYVIGKTGMGKTTMLENMVLQDIYNGHGIGVVDPHGDFAEKILDYIPAHRINDVVYVNPADVEYPVGFNILEVENEEQKHLVAAGLMAVFKKIWPDVWSARMEYILNNTLLALLDYEGSTLMGINRLLADKKFRSKVLRKLKDPVIKAFWTTEFANYEPRYQKEAVAPIQNKIGQFLSASVIRNMVAQVKSTINVREIMDSKKILIMNLSKGRIGEDNSRLLGGMLITEIQLAAMSRVDMPEEERQDFFLYVDEFQNFATPSFANILSEARKYRLSLIMAHQYVMQLDEVVADAVFGNVGSMVTFRVGAGDAEMLEKEYSPTFVIEDIVNLPKFQIFLKLMIDGISSQPFSAATMPPIGSPTGSAEKVIRVSRERYGQNKSVIEDKIARWSGMDMDDADDEETGSSQKKKSTSGEVKKDYVKKYEKKSSSDVRSSKPQDNNERKNNEPKKHGVSDRSTSNKKESTPLEQSIEKKVALSPKPTEPIIQKPVEKKPPLEKVDEKQITEPKTQDTKVPESEEPVVHLADLLPKKDTTKESAPIIEEKKSVSEKIVPDDTSPSPKIADTADTIKNTVPETDTKLTERDNKKLSIKNDSEESQKKKRKRRRKKKNNDSTSTKLSEHASERSGTTTKIVSTPPVVVDTVSEDMPKPKPLKQDQVVRFDQDDDDAWRSDK